MSKGNVRLLNLLNQTGLTVEKVRKHRDGDRTVTYVMEATDSEGNAFVGVGVAVRRQPKFNKSIGHQVAEAHAMQDLIVQVNPELLTRHTRKRVLKNRENRLAEDSARVVANSL